MIWLWILGLTGSFYVFIKLFSKYLSSSHERFWGKLGIPSESLSLSLWDSMTEKVTFVDIDPLIVKRMKERDLDFVGMTELGTRILFVRDPELIKQIMIKDADVWINHRKFDMSKSDPVLSKMLFFMESQEWKDMRSLLSPNFTTGKIKKMFERVSDCATMLVNHLDKGGDIEVRDTMSSYTMDVIASAFFGIEVHTIKNRDVIFAKMGQKMQAQSGFRLAKIMLAVAFPKLANQLGISFFEKEPTHFFHKVVKETITYREKNNVRRHDFLQLLIDYKNDGQVKKVKMDDDLIGAQAVLFLLGGFDTVETLLTFSAYHLALNPDIQDKILEEVKAVMARHDGQITYDGVNEMEYMDRFISENLRLYPPVPRLDRRNTVDYQIPGTKIVLPKESIVAFPSYALHRDPDLFENPNKFDPDRWLEKDKLNPYVYMPFGQGQRNCIGMRFAQIEAKTVIAHLALNFKMEPTARTPVPIVLTFKGGNMKPNGDIYVKFSPRT